MYKTISPNYRPGNTWQRCDWDIFFTIHLQGVDFSHLKDNLVAIAHQTKQSLRVMVGKLNRWGSLTLMHFVFGPCSTIVASEKGENVWVRGGGGGVILECLRCCESLSRSVRCKTRCDPSLMWALQPLWSATHMDLVVPNRKPPFSCWCESRFSQLWIYNVAYSSYTSNIEHNYTITSKAYNLSFIKVMTVCLPYGLIVFMYLPLFRL